MSLFIHGWLLLLLIIGTPSLALEKNTLVDVDAEALQKELKQAKEDLVLVNFWSTWCEPCLKEFPQLIELQKKFTKVAFYYVSMDVAQERGSAEKFLEQFPQAKRRYMRTGADDPFVTAISKQWGGVLPTTMIFDRQRQVIRMWQGEVDLKEVDTFLSETVRRFLKNSQQ